MPTFTQPPHVPIVTAGLGQEGAIHPGYDTILHRVNSADRDGASPIPLSIPGIPGVPHKLSQKIFAGDYMEMAKLLPDSWRMEELLYQQSTIPGQCPGPLRPRKRPVTDILTWRRLSRIAINCPKLYPVVYYSTIHCVERVIQGEGCGYCIL